MIGAYPIWVYGADCLQLSYRGAVAPGDVILSHEHEGQRWVDPVDMRALLTDETIEGSRAATSVSPRSVLGVRDDLDRYLRRIGRG